MTCKRCHYLTFRLLSPSQQIPQREYIIIPDEHCLNGCSFLRDPVVTGTLATGHNKFYTDCAIRRKKSHQIAFDCSEKEN